MSDGPHRSLPMRRAWKTLAARADNNAFAVDQVAEAMCSALAGDWRAEIPSNFVKVVSSLLENESQVSIFSRDLGELNAIRVNSESPLAATFVDAAADSIRDGLPGPQAIEQAILNTLVDRALREIRSVEEHYLRRAPRERAAIIRGRLQEAVVQAPLGELARAIAKGVATTRRFQPGKRSGLDEGVPL